MNSLPDKDFDQKLDQLLTASVSSGAEPADFKVIHMPERPRFNWGLFGAAVAGFILMGTLLFIWILKGPKMTPAETPVLGGEVWTQLSDGIIWVAESFSSPTVLIYAAIIMGAVYFFIGSRIMRLCRLY